MPCKLKLACSLFAVGDTDGSYKGKRYMYVPSDQGKFYKAREITSVLNVKVIPINLIF